MMMDFFGSTAAAVALFLLPLLVILCKKKVKETDKLKIPTPKKNSAGKKDQTTSTGTTGENKKETKIQARAADDMETVDGCKSNWGAVQDAV